MGKYDLSGECRCAQIQMLRSSEASTYMDDHLVRAHAGGYEASLYWCRKTGLLFHYSSVLDLKDWGPSWLRRVPGIRLKQDSFTPEEARAATRSGDEALHFHRPLVAHYIDPHQDGDVYSDPETEIMYLLVRGIDSGPLARLDELLAIAHLRVTEFDRDLPLASEAIRKRTCLHCSVDMTDVPRGHLCPICGSGEGAEVARHIAASRAATQRTATPGGCSWVAALVIGGVVVALVVLLRLITGPSA